MDDNFLELAAATYTGEPCRICGENISSDDLKNGAVHAGYSADKKSRSAHKSCWDANLPKAQWAFPEDSVD